MQTEIIKALMGAAGAGADYTYVDSLYSIDLYKGTGSTITINNGIDLSGEGGVVFIKRRDSSGAPYVFDTIRGANQAMMTHDQQSDFTLSNSLTAFNSNGFTLGTASHINTSGATYVAWTLRKADKLFTMGTYTGNGGTSQTISHNLGVTPAMIWVKMTNSNESWYVYHKDMGNGSPQNNANEHQMRLDSYAARSSDDSQWWNDTSPTASQFTVGNAGGLNQNNQTFQYYLFAHDQQEFGENDSHSIFKLGHYQGNGSSGQDINLGWEPQWIFIKCSQGWGNKDWQIIDSMRGAAFDGNDQLLQYNTGDAESSASRLNFTATGFTVATGDAHFNDNGSQYIYWAIRRSDGLVGTPVEAGTDVFAMDTAASSYPKYSAGFAPDWVFSRRPAVTESWKTMTRLTGTGKGFLNTSATWGSDSGIVWDNNTHFKGGPGDDPSAYQAWMWGRHAGFDVVADKGNGQTTKQIAHNLNAVPQMIWRKNRDGGSDNWQCYHFGLNGGTNPHLYRLRLNTNNSEDSDSYTWVNAPTSTQFTVGSNGSINRNNDDFITMLFASVEGISKVGSYTGTGNSNQYINVGHEPRFLIIKRTDSTGDWMVFDSLRGFGNSATNDSILKLNSQDAATSSNVMNLFSAGFNCLTSDSNLNASNGKYVYYSHA
jgi:hypothetical protein